MKILTLLYHDVVPAGQFEFSGFAGADANIYKLSTEDFVNHLNAVGKVLTAPQIRDLHKKGHVIGSHSCSHPPRISSLSPGAIFEEWSKSIQQLSEITGEPVWTASVPAGYYSSRVGKAAAEAGIRALFHSE